MLRTESPSDDQVATFGKIDINENLQGEWLRRPGLVSRGLEPAVERRAISELRVAKYLVASLSNGHDRRR